MVAKRGSGWRLAPSLVAMVDEADRIAPRRDRRSDGSIGDSAHQNRTSDHNPRGGLVRALDLDHDPRRGFDAHAHARNIAARRDPRIKYMISNGWIWNHGGGWRRYKGANMHTIHAHFSVTDRGSFDTSSWFGAKIMFPSPSPPPIVFTPIPEEEMAEYYKIVNDAVLPTDLPKNAVVMVTASTWVWMNTDDASVEREIGGWDGVAELIDQPKMRSMQRTRLNVVRLNAS